MKTNNISIQEISDLINIPYIGENYMIDGLNLVNRESLKSQVISYVSSSKYIKFIRNNERVKALFVTEERFQEMANTYKDLTFFVTENPEITFYNLHNLLLIKTNFYHNFDFEKKIGENCKIHESTIIENGVSIGNNVTIGYNSVIKKGTIIKDNCIIGCGSIIGSEGFQLIKNNDVDNVLIRHVGGCLINENVFIGDNTTICKSLFEDFTSIGNNTKIDNLVHIAHNCTIGKNCVITAGVILSGTTIIQDNVWIAPNSTILNKVIIENNSRIGIGAVVLRNVKSGYTVIGNPAKEI